MHISISKCRTKLLDAISRPHVAKLVSTDKSTFAFCSFGLPHVYHRHSQHCSDACKRPHDSNLGSTCTDIQLFLLIYLCIYLILILILNLFLCIKLEYIYSSVRVTCSPNTPFSLVMFHAARAILTGPVKHIAMVWGKFKAPIHHMSWHIYMVWRLFAAPIQHAYIRIYRRTNTHTQTQHTQIHTNTRTQIHTRTNTHSVTHTHI